MPTSCLVLGQSGYVHNLLSSTGSVTHKSRLLGHTGLGLLFPLVSKIWDRSEGPAVRVRRIEPHPECELTLFYTFFATQMAGQLTLTFPMQHHRKNSPLKRHNTSH